MQRIIGPGDVQGGEKNNGMELRSERLRLLYKGWRDASARGEHLGDHLMNLFPPDQISHVLRTTFLANRSEEEGLVLDFLGSDLCVIFNRRQGDSGPDLFAPDADVFKLGEAVEAALAAGVPVGRRHAILESGRESGAAELLCVPANKNTGHERVFGFFDFGDAQPKLVAKNVALSPP